MASATNSRPEPPAVLVLTAATKWTKSQWRDADSRVDLQARLPSVPLPTANVSDGARRGELAIVSISADGTGSWDAAVVSHGSRKLDSGEVEVNVSGQRVALAASNGPHQQWGTPERHVRSLGSVDHGQACTVTLNRRLNWEEPIYWDTITTIARPAGPWMGQTVDALIAKLELRTVDLRVILR